jgi:hypothetical protein
MAQGLTVTLTTGTQTVIAGDGLHGNLRVTIRNRGTGSAYLGSSVVTSSLAYVMTSADTPQTFTLMVGETLYGTSTGGAVLDVLRLGETTA